MEAIIKLLESFGSLTAVPTGLCVFNPVNVDINKLKDLVKQHPKLAVTYNQTKEFSKELNKEVEPFVWVGKNSKLVDGATAVDHLSSILS